MPNSHPIAWHRLVVPFPAEPGLDAERGLPSCTQQGWPRRLAPAGARPDGALATAGVAWRMRGARWRGAVADDRGRANGRAARARACGWCARRRGGGSRVDGGNSDAWMAQGRRACLDPSLFGRRSLFGRMRGAAQAGGTVWWRAARPRKPLGWTAGPDAREAVACAWRSESACPRHAPPCRSPPTAPPPSTPSQKETAEPTRAAAAAAIVTNTHRRRKQKKNSSTAENCPRASAPARPLRAALPRTRGLRRSPPLSDGEVV